MLTRNRAEGPALHRALVVAATCVALVGAICLLESLHTFAGERLIESLLVLTFLAVTAWATRRGLRNALVVACSLMFGLAVLEGVVLTMGALSSKPKQVVADDFGAGKGRPILGWGPTRPGVFRSLKVAADGHVIFDTHVTIDDQLNRKTVPSDGPRPIAFFGDSWIYGDGLDDDGTLPQAFADLNQGKIPVLNLAFAGWSPAQNLAALQHDLYAPLLEAPRHFILFTATFHLERTACESSYALSQAPRYIVENGTLAYKGPCVDSESGISASLLKILERLALYKRIAPALQAPSKNDVETYLDIVETFVSTSKRKYNVDTTVLFAPFRDKYIKGSGYTEQMIVNALRKAGVDVLIDKLPPVSDDSIYWIPDDGHPTALANKARARRIEAHLRDVDPEALETGSATPTR